MIKVDLAGGASSAGASFALLVDQNDLSATWRRTALERIGIFRVFARDAGFTAPSLS